MLESILDQMGVNATFFFHFGVFACLLFFLKHAFFHPLLKYLRKREEKTTLLAEQIRVLKEKTEERGHTYQRGKSKIQRSYVELVNQYQRQASEVRRKVLSEGRLRALEQLSKHREHLAKEYQSLSGDLILALNDIKKSLDTHLC